MLSFIQEPRHEVIIDTVNNRAPKFNQENYNVVNVSKTLPVGLKLDILNLYGIEAWVQDIDIKFELPDGAQIDDNITLTITGNIYRGSPVSTVSVSTVPGSIQLL